MNKILSIVFALCITTSAFAWETDDYGFPYENTQTEALQQGKPSTDSFFLLRRNRQAQYRAVRQTQSQVIVAQPQAAEQTDAALQAPQN